MKRETKAKGDGGIDVAVFAALLNRVHLKGMLEECVLAVKAGVGRVQAVDMSSSVFIMAEAQVAGPSFPDMVVGLCNLSLLCKFIGSAGVDGGVSFSFSKDFLTVSKRGQGHLKLKLMDTAMVPTAVEETGETDKETLARLCGPVSLDLMRKSQEDILYYAGLLNAPSVVFVASDKAILVRSSASMDNQFELRLCSRGQEKNAAVGETEVYGTGLTAALKAAQDEAGMEKITMCFGGGGPVTLMLDETNYWSLVPLNN